MPVYRVPATCVGERCSVCGWQAVTKVEEVVFADDPLPERHPLTTYLCALHFRVIMGPAAARSLTQIESTTSTQVDDS